MGVSPDPPHTAWLLVFAANMPLPLLWGSMVTDEAGRVGMLCAVPLLFGVGFRLCHSRRHVIKTVVFGGRFVALSQLFLGLHVFVGLMAVGVAGLSCQTGAEPLNRQLTTAPCGFVATIVTGGSLLTVAFLAGIPIQWVAAGIRRRRASTPGTSGAA